MDKNSMMMIVAVGATTNLDVMYSQLVEKVDFDVIIAGQLEMVPQEIKDGGWVKSEGDEGAEYGVLYVPQKYYHEVMILLGMRDMIKQLEDEIHEHNDNAPFAEQFFAGDVDAFNKMGDAVKKHLLRFQAEVALMVPSLLAKHAQESSSKDAILRLYDLKEAIGNAKEDTACTDVLTMLIEANKNGYPTAELTQAAKAFKKNHFEIDDMPERQALIVRARTLEQKMLEHVPEDYHKAEKAPALRIELTAENHEGLKKLSS